jgi:pyruvate dehydrogenase E1 component alpha subunit
MNNYDLEKIFFNATRIRKIENAISSSYHNKQMRCPIHLSVGQEVVASAICNFLDKNDCVVSSHRSHAHYLAKGGDLNKMMAELYGKKTGCSLGRGGSMHLIDLDVKFMGATAIVGNTIPVGVGIGESIAQAQSNNISVIFFGDGATEQGVFYESINYAAVRNIPTLFVCENNSFSVYTNMKPRQSPKRRIYKIVREFGIESKYISRLDIEGINEIKIIINNIKNHRQPFFIEIDTFRTLEHCGPSNDDHLGYRSKKEIQIANANDPLAKFEQSLLSQDSNFASKKAEKFVGIDIEIKSAFDFAEKSPFPDSVDPVLDVYKSL